MSKAFAPFAPDEVESLNAFQQDGHFHEFTCPSGDVLVANENGWTCPTCKYTQNWAHDFMKDWSWKKALSGF
jgi:hypothetical protein